MSHASSAHERNYLKQLHKTMKDMAAGAGHSQQTILLGRSAVSARHTKEFQDLYWSVCPTKGPGFRAQVQGWLQLEKCELASSLMHMVGCLENMADVLLQDLAVKQTYGDAQVAEYYSGSCGARTQLSIFEGGKQTILVSYPFLDPSHDLHSDWQTFSSAVRAEESRLHALCKKDTTMEQINVSLATLARQAAGQPVDTAASAAQPAPQFADAQAVMDLRAEVKRGFKSVVEEMRASSKMARVEISPSPAAAAAPTPVQALKDQMAKLPDELLVPRPDEYTAYHIWQLYEREPAPRLPSPSAYMRRFPAERKGWLGFLTEPACVKRNRSYMRIWANVVKLIRAPHRLSVEAACASLDQEFWRRKALDQNCTTYGRQRALWRNRG